MLSPVVKGYKVRRILKFNKQVNSMKTELRDIFKFILCLKIEFTEHMKLKNN